MANAWLPSKAAARRTSKRASTYYAHINGAPFACLVLVLLMIFAGQNMQPQYGVFADWPGIRNARPEPGALRDDAMRVTATRDGRFYFQNTIAALTDLRARMQKSIRQGSERKVYIVADERTKYADIKILLDQIQLAEVRRIAILTNESAHPTK
jgi:biopolymer transport protein ExbD